MSYKIVKQARAWWPVKWEGVAEDGAIVTNQVDVQFNLLKVDAAADWIAQMLGATKAEAQQNVSGDVKMLPAIYAGMIARIANNWRGFEAENGEPLAYDGDRWLEAVAAAEAKRTAAEAITDPELRRAALAEVPNIPVPEAGGENLRLVMNESGMFTHFFNAWRDCQAAKAEIRSGN
jgi:hypothetical protein